MNLDKDLELFYKEVLDSVELLVLEDGSIVKNKPSQDPIKTKSGKVFHLPYLEVMKNPQGKAFFHPLKENYLKPDTEALSIFTNHLTLKLNLKLSQFFTLVIDIAASPEKQRLIKNAELLDFISNVGSDIDLSLITELQDNIMPKAAKSRGEGFFLSFYLKKNGVIGNEHYQAICKTNFVLYKELQNGLDKVGKDYRIYDDIKVRKKDLLALINIMNATFPDIESEERWSVGTDNKVFRYFNALLEAGYLVSSRINHLVNLIIRDLGDTDNEALLTNNKWRDHLPRIYELTNVIRLIPDLTDVIEEAKVDKLDESKVANQQPLQFNPPTQQVNQAPPQVQQYTQQVQQPTQQAQPTGKTSLDDIVRGKAPAPAEQRAMMYNNNQQGLIMQPNMVGQQQFQQQQQGWGLPPSVQQQMIQQQQQQWNNNQQFQQPVYQQPMNQWQQPMQQPMMGQQFQQPPMGMGFQPQQPMFGNTMGQPQQWNQQQGFNNGFGFQQQTPQMNKSWGTF